MLYTEIKTKLTTYLNSDLPKSLFWQDGYSTDITKSIELQLYRIDNTINLKSKGIHHSAKNNLLKMLKAIDNEQFDIKNRKPAYYAKC